MAGVMRLTKVLGARRYCTKTGGWISEKTEEWTEKQATMKPSEDSFKLPKTQDDVIEERRQEEKENFNKFVKLMHHNKLNMEGQARDPWRQVEEPEKSTAPKEVVREVIGKKRVVQITEGQEVDPEAYEIAIEECEEAGNRNDTERALEAGISLINHPEVTEDNYSELVEEEPMPLILSCWAPHVDDSIAINVSLRLLIDAVNQGAPEPKLKLMTLDCNLNYGLSCHLNVSSLPTILAIHEGSLLEQQAGLVDEEGLAQFVFGYAQHMYGDNALDHLHEHLPICKLIDGRAALKANDYAAAFKKYSEVYSECMPKVVEERKLRAKLAESGEFTPEATRSLTDNEVMSAKSLAGLCLTLFHEKKYRAVRKIIHAIQKDLPKPFRVLSDVKKIISTVDIMMLSEYHQEDVEDLEDEERIDQHNLDIKLKLIGAYFGAGDFHKALSTTFILLRKNREYKDGIATLLMVRIMTYLGRHHPIREEYNSLFFEELRVPRGRLHGLPNNHKLLKACNEVSYGTLAEEIPLMIDPSPYMMQLGSTRHPLLR